MIRTVLKGVLRGMRVVVVGGERSEDGKIMVVATHFGQSLILSGYGRGLVSSYVHPGHTAYILEKNLSPEIEDAKKALKAVTCKIAAYDLMKLGKPNKSQSKKILECVPS